MIDIETVKFILMIDTLIELSTNGIKPISDIDNGELVEDCIYYDDNRYLYNALTDEKNISCCKRSF